MKQVLQMCICEASIMHTNDFLDTLAGMKDKANLQNWN